MRHQDTAFDRFSRALGARSSRRATMTHLGGAGLAVAFGANQVRQVSAEDDLGAQCSQTIRGTIATGDFTGIVFEGTLEFALQDGRIDDGAFTVTNANAAQLPAMTAGMVYPLVGSTSSRALHLRIAVDEGRFLTLEGTGQNEIADECGMDIAGTFGGPYEGTIGTWTTFVAEIVPDQPTPPPAPTNPPAPESTQMVCDPAPDCGVTFVLDEASCSCVCPGNNEQCGPVCCPGGSVCMDEASGTCSCPDGTEICGDLCVESCQPNYQLNDACECIEVV